VPQHDNIQEDPEPPEPVLDLFVPFLGVEKLRGGQEEADGREPRSGFGQDDF
jgi:hypothetical protein